MRVVALLPLLLAWPLCGLSQDNRSAETAAASSPAGEDAGGQASQANLSSQQATRENTSSGQLFSERATSSSRTNAGFILGIRGIYGDNLFEESGSIQTLWSVLGMSRFYLNVGRRKSLFHLDYGIGYRYYNRSEGYNTFQQDASLTYNRRLSRHVNFEVEDHLRFAPNDILSMTDRIPIEPFVSTATSQQLFFDNEKATINHLNSSLTADLTRNQHLMVSVYSDLYRYHSRPDQNTSTVGVNVSDDYHFSRRFFVNGTASNYWIYSVGDLRDGRVLRITGGPGFKPTPVWELRASYGIEESYENAGNRRNQVYDASISRDTSASKIVLRYTRRSTYQLGLPGINQSDIASAAFGVRLARRVSSYLRGAYYRTKSPEYSIVETTSGSAGLEYLLRRNLLASLAGQYLYQRVHGVPTPPPNVDRFLVFVAIQYMFPGVPRDYAPGIRPIQPGGLTP